MLKRSFAFLLLAGLAVSLCATAGSVNAQRKGRYATEDGRVTPVNWRWAHLWDDVEETEEDRRALAANNDLWQQSGPPVIEGEITQPRTIGPGRFILRGGVFVRSGASLTVRPGTTVLGENGSFLVIDRGARILARGTARRPIVFTSSQPVGSRNAGDWGGLVINGRAPINFPGGEADGEGNTGRYGGGNPEDDSGILRFVRVEFGGNRITATNELNGIAFQGVGRGTTVEFVQSIESADDPIEFFGGTVDIRYAIAVGRMDDGFDWTFGWSGRAQFVVVQQDGGTEATNGIEADNNANNHDLTPRSNPTLFNFTLIGDRDSRTANSFGAILREGTAGRLVNFVVQNFRDTGIRVQHDATLRQLNDNALRLENWIVFNNRRGVAEFINSQGQSAGNLATQFRNVREVDPQLTFPTDFDYPDFRPRFTSPCLNQETIVQPADDGFFEPVFYTGAMGPTEADDWTFGWTTFVRK